MKFSKIILAVAASFLIMSQAGAATIVGNLMDIYGGGIDRTIKISPKSTPQAVTYNGTNYTVMDLAKTVSSTNSVFAVVLLGGIYNVDFGTVNGVATPVTKILVPPYDTNTYSFNFVANLATNLGTFVWTNSYGIAAGTNITFTTNGALVKINASAPAAATVTNFDSITVTNFADIRGSLYNSTGTLNINQPDGDGFGISVRSGNGDNVGPNSPGGAVSIATGTSYGAQNIAADLSIQAGNGSLDSNDPQVGGRGSDVNIAAGTGSGGYRDGKINLNGTVTVTNSATMLSNVFIANNLYVTNHAYDVSTSRLDPLANEFVTAEYVQSVMAANFDLYFSTNSSGISITNVGTPSTMVVANPINSQTNAITSFTNGTYFTARLQTNSISYIQSVPINLYTYVQITGGGSVTAHPEMWLYNTNGTSVKLGYSSDNEYSSSIAVPVNLAIALTNTPYLNVNLTNSPQLLLRWYVTSTSGNPTWRFLIGNGNVSHITVGTIPSANQNYVGTFTGNGTGLTNIPSTGITGLGTAAYSNSTAFASSGVTNLTAGQIATIAAAVTNNASPTLTGLSVGAQTALDANGNGKVGGVGLTNGVLTGNGSGLTNISPTNIVGFIVYTNADTDIPIVTNSAYPTSSIQVYLTTGTWAINTSCAAMVSSNNVAGTYAKWDFTGTAAQYATTFYRGADAAGGTSFYNQSPTLGYVGSGFNGINASASRSMLIWATGTLIVTNAGYFQFLASQYTATTNNYVYCGRGSYIQATRIR
jgi:hypothetical protein